MFSESAAFPLQFPLILQEPLILYQEISEGNGKWSTVKYLEIQIPSKWDLMGEIVDHRSFFIFNYDIFSQVDKAQQQGLLRDSFQSGGPDRVIMSPSKDTNMTNKYQTINQKQKPLFATTDFNDRSEILLTYATDLHYCSTLNYLSKKPYEIKVPPGVRAKDYQFIFFKRKTERDELLIDVVGFRNKEKRLDLILAFLMKQLVYEVRYSKEGIKKQVEDAVERIFVQVLKHVFRYISKAMQIKSYKKMIELTYHVLVSYRQDFQQLFTMKDSNPLFCKGIKILKRDISSIVYKVMITEGLFPINCEINTMNDSYIKLKLLSMIADSEVLPWSPKFHASLALGNFHYSFTPNDQFNLRTLKTRKYNKNYQYISMKVLDFFPLDQWVDMVSKFFEDNLSSILLYIGEQMGTGTRPEQPKEEEPKFEKFSNSKSGLSGLREPLIRTNTENESIQERSASSILKPMPTETELISEQVRSTNFVNKLKQAQIAAIRQSKQSHYQSHYQSQEFRPLEVILESSSVYKTSVTDKEQQQQHKKQLQHFKMILKKSLKRITHHINVYDISIETPFMQSIKTQIADEFQQTYRYELEVSGILTQFCQIITETELRSYSTFVNNCQTPVAAFIYMLCDTYRPYSESLDPQLHFLHQCRDQGYRCTSVVDSKDARSKTTKDLTDLMWASQLPPHEVGSTKYRTMASKVMLSNVSTFYQSEFQSQLSQYLKYASSHNLLLMGQNFIQPAVLDKTLDYFGFYGDDLSAQYLKKMQKIDADLNSFVSVEQNGKFFGGKQVVGPSVAFEQENRFQTLVSRHDEQFFANYETIMDTYLKTQQVEQTTSQEISTIMKSIEQPQLLSNTKQNEINQLDLHYILIFYQNKMIQLKQGDRKNASEKHHFQQLYQEACYIYYNSVRLQLSQKVRTNSLSYIGFLLAKDLNQVSNEVPQNVKLQTLV